jgi:transcriptional regulator with XRE-family HTH domain
MAHLVTYCLIVSKRKVTISAITPAQSRAARGLLDWSRDQLAQRCEIAKRTIVRFEASEGETRPGTLNAIRAALEAAGVEFVAENGGGAGVRLKKLSDTSG